MRITGARDACTIPTITARSGLRYEMATAPGSVTANLGGSSIGMIPRETSVWITAFRGCAISVW
jgi:hypothetical protein